MSNINNTEKNTIATSTDVTTTSTQPTEAPVKTKINWKVRLHNKIWLAAMASLFISFIYGLLELLDIVPSISEGRTLEVVQSLLTVLGLVGVVTDPTTAGLGDSARALGYQEPWDDEADEGDAESTQIAVAAQPGESAQSADTSIGLTD